MRPIIRNVSRSSLFKAFRSNDNVRCRSKKSSRYGRSSGLIRHEKSLLVHHFSTLFVPTIMVGIDRRSLVAVVDVVDVVDLSNPLLEITSRSSLFGDNGRCRSKKCSQCGRRSGRGKGARLTWRTVQATWRRNGRRRSSASARTKFK